MASAGAEGLKSDLGLAGADGSCWTISMLGSRNSSKSGYPSTFQYFSGTNRLLFSVA